MGPKPGAIVTEGGAALGGVVTYGVSQRRAKKDEDRFCLAVRGLWWCSAAFCVFDGHNGPRVAEECSRILLSEVTSELEAGLVPGSEPAAMAGPGWPLEARRPPKTAVCSERSHTAHSRAGVLPFPRCNCLPESSWQPPPDMHLCPLSAP